MSLLSAAGVSRTYRRYSLIGRGQQSTVLHDLTLDIAAGQTMALLGRSGCGKSTLARLLAGLERPDKGDILFAGRPLRRFQKSDWQEMRCSVQMVFQDAIGAVDPRATVEEILAEPLRNLCNLKGAALHSRVRDLLAMVELGGDDCDRFPHQLSGGQLQRVCIARALAPNPRLIILDEAVSNLDLHLQIQMLDLFARLQRDHGVAYLFITHDLRLVERFCSRVVVMDQGRLVEDSPVRHPLHLASREGRALAGAVLPAFPAAPNP